ncbi:hypothetical protein GGQ74_001292 [Desulfobaculum xiamenense]|uniref:SPOR domain-containing protein n=1 Tax=Desulfobaculum xiamenense TaxID=995050 RepID=A0A846QMG5_9BACT|nr:SPOR domain-containing protein [Desulfobaculum xiamenense]NJB67652.1 hypothetical protein [Desulfobaculum xiamenense]
MTGRQILNTRTTRRCAIWALLGFALAVAAWTLVAPTAAHANEAVYSIQIAGYKSRENALKQYAILSRTLDATAFAQLRIETSGNLHMLRLGSFATRAEATDTLKRLAGALPGAYVIHTTVNPAGIILPKPDAAPNAGQGRAARAEPKPATSAATPTDRPTNGTTPSAPAPKTRKLIDQPHAARPAAQRQPPAAVAPQAPEQDTASRPERIETPRTVRPATQSAPSSRWNPGNPLLILLGFGAAMAGGLLVHRLR